MKYYQKEMKCPLCDWNKVHTVLKDNNKDLLFSILACDSCTNAWTHPSPSSIDYQSMDFHALTSSSNDLDYSRTIDDLPKEWKKSILMQVSCLKRTLPPKSKILEIGCGEGLLLNELSREGFHVKGIEPSITGSQRAKSKGLDVITGYFSNDIIKENFDAVILSHVLEHCEEPVKILTQISNILPCGYLLLIQTNYKGLIPRILGEQWYAWVPEEHYWHFTSYGLGLVANQAGYETVACEFSSLVHWWRKSKILQKIASIYPSSLDQFHLLLKREHQDY